MGTNAGPAPLRSAAERRAEPAFGALDLGTSNCRMMVARSAGAGGFRVVDSLSRIVSLGEGLAADGALSPEAMDRALSALAECASRFARNGVASIDAVATEACRRAANGQAFLRRAERETGLAIRIVSTRQEAELVVESCADLLAGSAGRKALLLDIGGGSTELVWVRSTGARSAPAIIGTCSLPFGVLTLEDMAGADAATEDGFEHLIRFVAASLAPFEAVHRIRAEILSGEVRLLGTSGTVTTLAGEVLGLRRYRRPLVDGVVLATAKAAEAALRLRALNRDGLPAHPCIGPERAHLVLPGCAIFEAIRRQWPAPELLVADRGLREGMLLRLLRCRPDRARSAVQGGLARPAPPAGPPRVEARPS